MGRIVALGLALAVLAGPAAAQRPEGLRLDSLPPLPDTLRIYGDTLVVGGFAINLAPPPGAIRLTLEEAVRFALLNNPGLAVSVAEAERAQNDFSRGNAGFLPTLDAGAQLGGSRSGGLGGGGDSTGASSARASTSLSTDLTLGYTLFDGGRRSATYRRLGAEAAGFALAAEADAETLAFAVTAAYLDVTRQEGLAVALTEAVLISEDRLRLAQARVAIGVAAEIEAALALADLNADRAALVRQGLALIAARAELGGLLALPDPAAVAPSDTLALAPPPEPGALAAAERENRRVRALEAQVAAAREAVLEARAERFPAVRLAAGVGLAALDRGFLPPAFDPSLGPDLLYGFTATLPLLDAGDRRRRRANAEIRVRQADLAVADERAALRADAARLGAAAGGYRQLVALEGQNRVVARQNVRVALAQFQLGLLTPIDLRQVQLALLDAEARLVDAVYLARLAEAELRLLAGDLLPSGAAVAPETPRAP